MRRSRTTLMLFGLLLTGLILAGCSSLSESTDMALTPQITNGQLDAGEHPYVGFMRALDANGNFLWPCSGTLISPKIFLTAGHCIERSSEDGTIRAEHATICFLEQISRACLNVDVEGTLFTHPQYDPNDFTSYDLGVVFLGKRMKMDEYGLLPTLGVLDDKKDEPLTVVGYGLQETQPVRINDFTRRKAVVNIVKLDSTSVIVSANSDTGGTCFGDSGGPQFLSDSNIVAAVTSFGLNDNTCSGITGGYRVDTADDLEWLESEFGKYLDSDKSGQ